MQFLLQNFCISAANLVSFFPIDFLHLCVLYIECSATPFRSLWKRKYFYTYKEWTELNAIILSTDLLFHQILSFIYPFLFITSFLTEDKVLITHFNLFQLYTVKFQTMLNKSSVWIVGRSLQRKFNCVKVYVFNF